LREDRFSVQTSRDGKFIWPTFPDYNVG
jgi:hypothetical protein